MSPIQDYLDAILALNSTPLTVHPITKKPLPKLPNAETLILEEDRILVFPDEEEKVSAGGIIIPDTAQEKPKRGIIVMTGPGYLDKIEEERMPYIRGQVVYYGKYDGTEVDLPGFEKLLLIRSSGVFFALK